MRVNRYLVVGATGAALVLIAAVLSLAGFRARPPLHGDFFRLAERLGYAPRAIGPYADFGEPGTTMLLRLSDKEPRESEARRLAEFVEAGGLLIAAGASGLEERLGLARAEEGDTVPLDADSPLLEGTGSEGLRFSTWMAPVEEEPGAFEILAKSRAGLYAVEARLRRGRLVLVADDRLFSDWSIRRPESAVLANALIARGWGRRLAVLEDAAESGSVSSFRLFARPGGGLAAVQLLVAALAAGLALGFGFGPRRKGPISEVTASRGSAEAVGGFYRRSRALSTADRLLALGFAKRLRGLLGAPRAGIGEVEAAAVLLIGPRADALSGLLEGGEPRDGRALAAREAERKKIGNEIEAAAKRRLPRRTR